jgi:hypothetical protein
MVAGVVSGNPNGTLNATSGIATATAGFIIIYGTATSIYQLAVSSSCTAGDRLVPVAGQTYLAFQTAGDGSSGHFCAAVTISSSSASGLFSTSVFVRCM